MGGEVIEARGLSKRYILSHQERYLTLRDRLTPGYLVDRLLRRSKPETREEFWALKDISFDVKEGEALAVIGRNGAGKSTLLKILSRIASPTSGTARIRGRMASLLEVGTGFHPELTGRENIYLNGAILGMKTREIERHFDAIVAFSGVEKFLDTPVKRYSSGMYVRLAFAVAAHLEPDILVVDEVLAVGDAEFQRKCLGKMQDVSREEGRTILFVSHNMTAVQTLCRRAIWLNDGKIAEEGATGHVVAAYLSRHGSHQLEQSWPEKATAPGNEQVRVRSIRLIPRGERADSEISVETPLTLEFDFWNMVPGANLNVSFQLNTLAGECIFAVGGGHGKYDIGLFRVSCDVPGDFLNDGIYLINMYVVKDTATVVYALMERLTFQVNDTPRPGAWLDKWPGAVRPTTFRWQSTPLEEPKSNGRVSESRGLTPAARDGEAVT